MNKALILGFRNDGLGAVIQGPDNSKLVIDGMVRREIQILVRVSAFAEDLDLKRSVRLDNGKRVQESKRVILLSFSSELCPCPGN